MRIYKRNGTYWADYFVAGVRVRKSLRTTNKAAALVKLAKIEEGFKLPTTAWESFLVRFRTHMKATKKIGTIRHFEQGIRALEEFRHIKEIKDITPALVDELATHLKAQKSDQKYAAGINRKIRAIKTMMRQAEFWDLIPPQNWKKVSKFKESSGRVEFHTPEEIKQILEVFNSDWQLVVLLGCRAGLRRGEIAALKWADIDFKNQQIYVRPNKTEKHRYVPISEDLLLALKQANKESEYVVAVGEARDSKDFLSAYYRKATSKLPFNCILHKLRHTFASHLVQNNVDLYRVSKLLGHSSIRMTEIYAHLAPADLKDAIKHLPKF